MNSNNQIKVWNKTIDDAPIVEVIEKRLPLKDMNLNFREQSLLNQFLAMGWEANGLNVTEDTVYRLVIYTRCLNIISDSIGMLPIQTYREEATSNVKLGVKDHPIVKLLKKKPNNLMTCFIFQKNIGMSLLSAGNAYVQIVTNGRGDVIEFLPLPSNNVTPRVVFENNENVIYYDYKPNKGSTQIFKSYQILHFKGFSKDGIVGLKPLDIFRKTLKTSMLIEDHATNTFENGANIKGIVKHPKTLDPTTSKNLRDSFKELYSGGDKSGTVAVFEEGMEFQAINMSLADLQFLEQRKFEAKQICNMFGIPPHMVSDLEKGTYNNMEQQGQQYKDFTLLPHLINIEQEFNYKLFGDDDLFVKFNVNGLARADLATRTSAYATMITNGVMTRNECRALEELPAIEGLDQILVPLNMTTNLDGSNSTTETPKKDPIKPKKKGLNPVFVPVLTEIMHRFLTKEQGNPQQESEEKKSFLRKMLRNSFRAMANEANINDSLAEEMLGKFVDLHFVNENRNIDKLKEKLDLEVISLLEIIQK